LKGADMFVVRLAGNGVGFANSRPCRDCLLVIKRYRLGRVFYSTENGSVVVRKVNEMDEKDAITTSMERNRLRKMYSDRHAVPKSQEPEPKKRRRRKLKKHKHR